MSSVVSTQAMLLQVMIRIVDYGCSVCASETKRIDLGQKVSSPWYEQQAYTQDLLTHARRKPVVGHGVANLGNYTC